MFVNRNLSSLSSGLRVSTGIKAGSPDAPGGGGGNGGGNGTPPDFSQDQWDAIEGKFTPMLQGAVASALKRAEKASGDKIDALTKMIEKLQTQAPKTTVDPDADPDEGGKRNRNRDRNDPRDVDFATMQQKLQTQQDLLETIKRERDQERSKNRDAYLRQVSTRHLQAIGVVDAINQDLAITNLIAKGILGYEADDSDRVVWRSNGDTFDAEQGFRQWSRSPEAQRLFPAAGTRGSGSTRGNGQGSGVALTPEEVARNAWRALGDNIDQ